MKAILRVLVLLMPANVCWHFSACYAQHRGIPTEWQLVFRAPAVSGYEQSLSNQIRNRLREFSPKTDSLGNVYVVFGSGAPHRLIVTPIDEPGYIVSDITQQGYLRVQRVPQISPNAVFDTLSFAQPVTIQTRDGRLVNGVFAGLSKALQFDRKDRPAMNHPNELYIDIGARNVEEVQKAGVDLFDPVVLERNWFSIGKSGEAGPAVGDRFGAYALVQILEQLKESSLKGTTTIAFITQQWMGGRGLARILAETGPDELLYVGRLNRKSVSKGASNELRSESGVLIGTSGVQGGGKPSLADQFQVIAAKEHIPISIVASNELGIQNFGRVASIPERRVELGVPTSWAATPSEFVSEKDVARLSRLIGAYLEIPKPLVEALDEGPVVHRNYRRPEALVDTEGVSGHEEEVREVVLGRLILALRKMAYTDAAGNLILHFGNGKKEENAPRILFLAHMDEIGYEVRNIEEDGRLQVDTIGESYDQYFMGHLVLVHKKEGRPVGGVLELPKGWDRREFQWPSDTGSTSESRHVFVGTYSKEETEKLGIAIGDIVTTPKKYHRLLGTRVSASSLDDRVGCAALITAANALGPDFSGRDVTFVWSVEREVESKGATKFAEQAAENNQRPDFVFAIDAFFSFDSPLESKRNTNVELGKGFVVRALDDSNVVPPEYLERVIALAKKENIPLQYGVSFGDNEGAVFLRYGSIDVPLGWPLLYSHSAAEEVDTQDFNALAKIIETIARKW
jgi:putative aminopeptidase